VYFGFVAVACYYHLRGLFGTPSQAEVDAEYEEREKHEKHDHNKPGNTIQ
jgi:hypothetical protein